MKSRFSVEQIIKVLRECEVSENKAEVLQRHNISQQTYYHWRCKYQGMDVQELLMDFSLLRLLRNNNRQDCIVLQPVRARLSVLNLQYLLRKI